MTKIDDLDTTNLNQTIRWTLAKENHANDILHILSDYFLTQRIKPLPKKASKKEIRKYHQALTIIHTMSFER